MAVKTVVVPVTAAAEDEAGHSTVLALAKQLDAHVDAVFVRPDPETAFVYMGIVPSDTDRATNDARARIEAEGLAASARAKDRFSALCHVADIAMPERPDPARAPVQDGATWRASPPR